YESKVLRRLLSVARLFIRVVPVLLLVAVYPAAAADDAKPITPAEWLESQKKPAFRDGHTLPRLTRFGWVLPTDARIKLAEDWGYAVEFGGYVDDKVVARLDDPKSDESKLAALAKADPARYPIAVICSRRLPGEEAPAEAWTRDKDGKVLNAKAQSMDGTQWSEGKGAVWSPEAPDAVWQMAGAYRADPLRELQKRGVPLSIVLNGGEYGLGVLGFAKKVWSQDPRVAAAAEKNGGWRPYASARKGHAERIIADAVRAAVPDRKLYVYYTAGGRTLRNKDWSIDDWGATWEHMRGVSDLPSSEVYYRHFNDGFTGRLDMLTLVLNAVAFEIASGDPLSYNWVAGGWVRGDEKKHVADMDRWIGFLKCYYTAGMLGANVGYYEYPKGGFGVTFPADEPPVWLRQMAASAHVHALFSQLEDLVRTGDLVPGPMKHSISTNDPAYEFPTGDATARVLVRKHRTRPAWLVTAWAADGPDRDVTVTVPDLGRLTLRARGCGSVYEATLKDGTVTLTQHDEEGSTFTRAAPGKPVSRPVDLTVAPPPARERLLWLAADHGVVKDAAGKVSAWQSRGDDAGSLPKAWATFAVQQTEAAKQPLWVADAVNGQAGVQFEKARVHLGVQLDEQAGAECAGPLTVCAVFTGAVPKGDNRVVSGVVSGGNDYIPGMGFKIRDGEAATELATGVWLVSASARLDAPLERLGLGVMNGGTGGPGFTGALAEVLVYKGAPTPSRLALIEQYLRPKYGKSETKSASR
ncbi:MAG: hypothetical protein ACKO6B_07760, partial [Planctomycetia bacterium]